MSVQIETQQSQIGEYGEDLLEEMYRQMRQIRAFELAASELSESGDLPGPIHLYLGQEAIAVGTCLALGPDDIIGSTHRGHGHVLAKGADVEKMMAELAGKSTGLNRGRGGSMHMVEFSLGIFGCNAIVGASVPHVAGGALSSKLDGDDRVSVAFFGDGASNQGVVHETMNMAAAWDLPVVFLCENNYYAMGTSLDRQSYLQDMSKRGEGVGMKNWQFEGFDVVEVYENIARAVDHARSGEGPVIVEAITYRYRGHSMSDPAKYRAAEEVEDKKKKDCLALAEQRLTEHHDVSRDEIEAIREEVKEIAQEAYDFADQAEIPDPSVLYRTTYKTAGD